MRIHMSMCQSAWVAMVVAAAVNGRSCWPLLSQLLSQLLSLDGRCAVTVQCYV